MFKIIDKHSEEITKNLPNKEFKEIFRNFTDHIRSWDGDFTINSTQATVYALWELQYHVSFLQDQIPQKIVRESMVNIPDSDLFLMHILENLFYTPNFMNKYCQSQITMYDDTFEIPGDNKCLLSLAYNAIYAWKILKTAVSQDPKDWKWGAVHRQYYEHVPFSQIPGFKSIFHREVEAAGSKRTLSFACYDYFTDHMERDVFFKSLFSANFRAVVDMATYDDPEKYPLYMSIDAGASQHPFSKHYFDMNEIHYSQEGRIMEIGLEKAKKNAKYHLELIPKEQQKG